MEPHIQYAKTQDGVSIAYSTFGKGAPLVITPRFVWGHLQMRWENPDARTFPERMAEKRQVIDYDHRGSGLSEREVTDFSLESFVRDLEAVVDHLGLDRFALMGSQLSGPVAITYAARHPERVSHLVLWCTFARTPDYGQYGDYEAVQSMTDTDWELYTETRAHVLAGWEAGEWARRFAAYMRESISPEAYPAHWAARKDFDVSSLLPSVKSRTLVLHRRQIPLPDVSHARGLASRIPDARLVLQEGERPAPSSGDTDAVVRAIGEFLGDAEESEPRAEPATQGATGSLVTILFTDMESSTALTQQLGDAAAQEVRRAHNEIVRSALTANGGAEIKHTGDGIMASFATASSALDCAIAIQCGVAAHKEDHPDSPLAVYVGLNAGEPIAEDDDLFGTSVDLAARLVDHAQPGQIVVADVVRQLAAGKQFLFADLGETELRGLEDPVKLWELRWQEPG